MTLHGVADARIVRRAQPEAHEGERVGAHHQRGRLAARPGRPVLDRHEAVERRCRVGRVGRRDAHVVALDAQLLRERRTGGIGPVLDQAVPDIGGLAQIGGLLLARRSVGEIGGGQKRGDLDREREGRIAAILLPSVLRRSPVRCATMNAAARFDHRPEAEQLRVAAGAPSRRARSASRIGKAHSSICTPFQ